MITFLNWLFRLEQRHWPLNGVGSGRNGTVLNYWWWKFSKWPYWQPIVEYATIVGMILVILGICWVSGMQADMCARGHC